MSDSTDKPTSTALKFKTQQDQQALDPGAGTAIEMEALEAISAGNDSPSCDPVLFRIDVAKDKMRQELRDAYRTLHPYAHPNDVENAIKGSFSSIAPEGQSGA